jgi:hypothetical protein
MVLRVSLIPDGAGDFQDAALLGGREPTETYLDTQLEQVEGGNINPYLSSSSGEGRTKEDLPRHAEEEVGHPKDKAY